MIDGWMIKCLLVIYAIDVDTWIRIFINYDTVDNLYEMKNRILVHPLDLG